MISEPFYTVPKIRVSYNIPTIACRKNKTSTQYVGIADYTKQKDLDKYSGKKLALRNRYIPFSLPSSVLYKAHRLHSTLTV